MFFGRWAPVCVRVLIFQKIAQNGRWGCGMKTWLEQAKEKDSMMQKDRRWLHAHAEVGFSLDETRAYVMHRLEEIGCIPRLCGGGVVAMVGKGKTGDAFLLRADMDALPMKEKTGLSYAARNGNMHACGHDLHTAMLLGAATLLKGNEGMLKSPIKLVFQPAEETLEGAKTMIENGVLEGPKVGAGMMLHVLSGTGMRSGTIIVSSPGVSAPAADFFTIKIKGKSCHGSSPEGGRDALNASAYLLVVLQSIVAREVSIASPAVLTIGKLSAGVAGNVIADTAILQGTLRAYDEGVRAFVKERLQELVKTIAKAFRVRGEVFFDSGAPSLQNDEAMSNLAYQCAKRMFGKEGVCASSELGGRVGGSEDFAFFSQCIPAVMIGICADVAQGKETSYPLHHPKVCFQESVLPLGAALLAATAHKWSVENAGMKKSK